MPPPKRSFAASKGWKASYVRLVTAVYGLLVAYVSLAPGQRIPGIFDWGRLFSPDKIAHFGVYAIFAVLLSFSIGGASVWKRAATAVLFSAGYGAIMEVLQGVSGAGRQFDPVDMVANLIGALLGGAIFLLLQRILNKIPVSAGA